MPVHFPTLSFPSISGPSLSALKAKFTAFKAKVSSALQSIGHRNTEAVKPIQSRTVQTASGPLKSAIQDLKSLSPSTPASQHSAAFNDLARGLAQAVKQADKENLQASVSDLSQRIADLMKQPTLLTADERKLLKNPADFIATLSDAAVAASPEADRRYVRDSLSLLRQGPTFRGAFDAATKSIGDTKQLLLAQHDKFDRPTLKTDLTLADLPTDLTGSVEFKALMGEMAATLASGQSDDAKQAKLQGELLPRLQTMLKTHGDLQPKLQQQLKAPGISPSLQLALTLSDGKAFMESLGNEIIKSAPPNRQAAVSDTLARLGKNDGWRQLYQGVTANIGATATHFDQPNKQRTLTIGQTTYQFSAVLGKGNFGDVLLFKDPNNRNDPGLVVKVPKGGTFAEKVDGPAREGRELVKALGTGASAQNIAPLKTAIRTSTGELLLVMPLAKNGSLQSVRDKIDQAKAEGTIDASLAAQLKLTPLVDLAKALQHEHLAKGQLHFDIAARNVLVDQQGNALLADFGLTEEMKGEGPADGEVRPAAEDAPVPIRWSSPERITGKPTNAATDSWMFGMALWEVVYGEAPFTGMSQDDVVGMFKNNAFDPNLDLPPINTDKWPNGQHAQLRDLLQKVLQTDPTKRPSMEEILRHPALNTGIIGTPTAKDLLAAVLADMAPVETTTATDNSSSTSGNNYNLEGGHDTSSGGALGGAPDTTPDPTENEVGTKDYYQNVEPNSPPN